jgi:hypothetical protein
VIKSYSFVATEGDERTNNDGAQVYIILAGWSLPFSQKRWDNIRYGVFGSLAVYHWREHDRIQICLP